MNTKVSKRSIACGLIIVLLMMAFSFAFCMYSFWGREFNHYDTNINSLWVIYGFTMFAFVLGFGTTILAFERRELRSRVFGVPIVLVGFVVIVVQLILDAVIMAIGAFLEFNESVMVILLVTEVIFVIFALIVIIARQAYRTLLIEPLDKQKIKQSFINEIRIQLQMMAKTNDIESLDRCLNRTYETAKYADPVSNMEVKDIEDEIAEAIENAKVLIQDGDAVQAKENIHKIENLLKEREIRLKVSK